MRPVQVIEFREPGVFSGRPAAHRAPAPLPAAAAGVKRSREPDGLNPALKRALSGVGSKKSIWASVAELGASGFSDSARKALAGAQLAAVGGHVKDRSQGQRMPFKMYLGVSKARAERSAKAEERARVSGVVLPKKKKKAKKQREKAAPDEPIPNTIRGSVMHVKQ